MKVSILVPFYNTKPDELQECLDSLLRQEFERYEIIIVDDGSQLCSVRESLLADYLLDSKLNLIRHSKNIGLPSARNTALKAAKGEYLVHVDSDDFWISTDVLTTLYSTAVIDGCDVLRFNGQYAAEGRLGRPVINRLNCINTPLNSERQLQTFRSVFLFFCRRQFVLENNLFFNAQINLGEDAVYVSKLLASSEKISSISKMCYAYRIDNVSMMRQTWDYENFADENNAALEVIKNLSSYPSIAIAYSRARYNTYMLKSLFPRAVMDLNRYELSQLSALYIDTKKDMEAILGAPFLVGWVFRLIAGYYQTSGSAQLDRLLVIVFQKIYPKTKQYYKFFGVKWIFTSIIYRVRRSLLSIGVVLPRKGRNKRPVENIEGLTEYNLKERHGSTKGAKKGLSVMLRVKNEELGIVQCIESIIDLCTELVVIDNKSTDQTVQRVNQIISSHAGGHKIKVHHYPFQVARCGLDHNGTPEDSVHSLSYYYNWCLDKCSCGTVIKWDADMVVSKNTDRRADFERLLARVKNARWLTSGNFISQNCYLTSPDEGYLAKKERNREIRIFSNNANVFFVKAKDFEVLAFFAPSKIIRSDSIFSFEIKRLWTNEFDHWSNISFNNPRKVKEYRSFQHLKLFDGRSVDEDYCSIKLSEL